MIWGVRGNYKFFLASQKSLLSWDVLNQRKRSPDGSETKKNAKFNLIVCHCQFSFQKSLVFLTRTSRNLCGKSKLDKQNPTRSPRFFFLFLAGQHCFPNWKHKMLSWRRNNKRTTETATSVCFTNHTSSNGFFLFILLFFFKRKGWQCICFQKRSCFNSFKKSYSFHGY